MPGNLLPSQTIDDPYSSSNNHPESFTGSSTGTIHNSVFAHLISRPRSNKTFTPEKPAVTMPSANQAQSQKTGTSSTYAESTFSTTSTLKPLVKSKNSSSKTSFRQKTKKFLSSLGEPPTAAYERKQLAAIQESDLLTAKEKATLSQKQLDRIEKQRTQMALAMDYGPMSRGVRY